jgi:hypothetical protein
VSPPVFFPADLKFSSGLAKIGQIAKNTALRRKCLKNIFSGETVKKNAVMYPLSN